MRTLNMNETIRPVAKKREVQSLQKFQKEIVKSLLEFSKDDDETIVNSRLVSAMLFMLHISGEIVKSYTFGDEEDTRELLMEAIEEANFSYKDKKSDMDWIRH
jgi:hypothetical protein